MLVTFESKAYANIIYFGDIAKQLLRMMGHSGTVPGAILADDVPQALSRLQSALAQHAETQAPATDDKDDARDKERPVQLKTRALPLLELLTAATKDQCDVMWR